MNTTEKLKMTLKENLYLFNEPRAVIATFWDTVTILGYGKTYVIDFLDSAKGTSKEWDIWLDFYIAKTKLEEIVSKYSHPSV